MIRTAGSKISAVDRRETLRYLGIAGREADEATAAVLDECEGYVLAAQDLKACYATFDIAREADGTLDLGFCRVKSRDLSRNLEGCGRIILFACTAGVGIDRLIAKYSRISPVRAAVIQAMGSALVEQWCDELCDAFKREYGDTKPRFSCGFGDLPLALQRDIFRALSVTHNIGITLSDGCFMTPTKSVTAVVGIKEG